MESILSPHDVFQHKVGNNRERTKQKSIFLYVKPKFLFEAKQQRFSYGTLFASLKAKEFRLSKRNQIKKYKQKT